MFKNGPKRGSQKSDRFEVFQGSIPAWSLGCPWGGSRAQKHIKMEAQTHILYDFRKMFSRYLETLWKYFVCSLKNKLIVFDVNLLFSLLRLGGKTYGGCFPDASQMPLRCVPDASQMLLKCKLKCNLHFSLHLRWFPPYPRRCLPDASQMPLKCLSDASQVQTQVQFALEFALEVPPRCLSDASQVQTQVQTQVQSALEFALEMPPRCLPDVSQIPLRCLSDVTEMLPRVFQMPFKCLSDACRMALRCFSDILYPNTRICLGSRAGVNIIFRALSEKIYLT